MSISTITADGQSSVASNMLKNIIRNKNYHDMIRFIKNKINNLDIVREGFIAIGDFAFESLQIQRLLGKCPAIDIHRSYEYFD